MRRGPWRLLLPVGLVLLVLGLAAVAPDTADARDTPNFAEEVASGARRLVAAPVSFVLGREVDVGLVEVVLVGLVLAWGFGLWRERRRRFQPGSINVEPFVDATGDEVVSAPGLTALVKDRLAGGGLLPAPALPSGAMATGFVELVEASPLPQAKWLGAALNLARRLVSRPPRSHKLTGTLRSSDGTEECGLSVELVDGNTGQVQAVATFWESTHVEAAKAAAGFAYARVMHTVADCLPLWQAWTNLQGDSVTLYHRGLECEQALVREKAKEKPSAEVVAGRLQEALKSYEATLEREPMNVLVQMRKANLHELADQWAKAFDAYLDALERWPHVFEARYRLAVTLTFMQRLGGDSATEEAKAQLLERLRRWMKKRGIPLQDSVPDSTEALRRIGLSHLERLHRDIRFSDSLGRWIRTWVPSWSGERERWRERHLYGELARPWSRTRRLRRNVVAMARLCTGIQLGRFAERDVTRILWPGRAKNWQVRYNAACCYSRLFERERSQPQVTKAVRQLELAYEEAGGHLELGWLRTDPDLVPLHGADEFRRWLARPPEESPATPPSSEPRPRPSPRMKPTRKTA
ncbi:MAG: hypothetical protein M3N31_03150 [Actinomycetota bacterium]|nr:hypothetical protein [Actinomycetota bacterium]